uniref:Cytoplasmic FMR1-interacting protein n=1 Tax=Steinernema glaseri TaxID=37863 RepID=A0A1I7YB62_9BILA
MAADSVTLADAIGNVELLDDFQLTDSQPVLEAHCAPLDYRVSFDTNFEDRNAFITGNAKYIEEATRHGEFSEMLAEGFQHAGNLYTWRCCSRAVPMAKSNDQPNRVEINKTVIKVLIPEVDKLHRFMKFSNDATKRFCAEIKRLCHPEKRKDFVSEAYLLTLGKFMNMFAVLDELKNMKASIKNDFSTFRRAAQSLQSQQDVKLPASETIRDMHDLSMFLATHNKIRENLKAELQSIDGYEEILADVVNICSYLFENHMYISPDERHMFVKVLAFSLYLMDGPEKAFVNKLDQKKRISIASLDKIFESLEVVPLYGDMQIQPFSFVRKCAHFDVSKWPLSNVESVRCHVNIVDKVKSIRQHHAEYVTHLSRINNEAVVYEVEGPRTDSENRELTEVTLSGIQLLCSWTSDVVETISWKLLHPTNTRENPDCPETAEEYERATRYNYSAAEKAALIEVISMIKGLQKLLKRMEADFTQAIRKHIYAELQDFVRNTLREPLQKAMKNKKDVLSCIIQSICDTCVDNRSGQYNPRSNDLISKNKKKRAEAASSMTDSRFEARNVPPSTTQLYMARTMLESLISEREKGTGRRVVRKEIDPKHSKKMVEFLRMSYHWPALLNFSRTLEQSSELSQLWFREFYLEVTMGKRIQFPIEMSMPWILTDYILTSEDPALTECILYQLDLYNDAAMYSLCKFKKQFLYDEVEAEVNLCFDQFVYKLSDAVFTYYKQLSASMLLDKQFKSECTKLGITIRTPACARFESLLKQRHIQLLGRSIDLNRLVGQRLNIAILRSLDVAISKFESESLTSIVELEQLIQANRLCHRLLKEHVGSLADFNDLLTEANHNVSAPYGRIALHSFWEINYDFIPHYSYNGSTHRFVRSKVHYREEPVRQKPPTAGFAYLWGSKSLIVAFSNIFSMYAGFIGSQHLKALARLLGYQGIAVIVEELVKLSNHIINGPLRNHVRELMNLMPKVCKMPFYDYGSPAILEYYLHHLKEVLAYPELKRDLFQVLREFGNNILFCMQLELALGQEEISDLLCAAPFTNVIPRPQAKTTEEQEQKMKRLEQKYQRIQIASMIDQIGNRNQTHIAREGELLTKERLCCGLNIFENILQKLRGMLHDHPHNPIWNGPDPDNGIMWIDECNQFHRIWSAIQFAICDTLNSDQPRVTNGNGDETRHTPLVEEVFGDSVHWAGCVIIMLLGQHRRFEVLDFCYHILRVHRADGKDGMAEGRKLSRFVDRIRRVQLLNNQILAILNNYTQTLDAMDDRAVDIDPPVHRGY